MVFHLDFRFGFMAAFIVSGCRASDLFVLRPSGGPAGGTPKTPRLLRPETQGNASK
jgi:hypothetical protein